MRVCFISFEYPPKIIGGLGTYAENLVKGLDDNQEVELCTITRGDKNVRNENVYRLSISDTPYWRRFYFIEQAISLAYNLNKTWKFDLIHLNGPYPIIRKPKLPTVSTFHSAHVNEIRLKVMTMKRMKSVKDIMDFLLKAPVGCLFDITTARASDSIISVSPHLSKIINSYCLVDKRKISMIPNGLDLTVFDQINDYDGDILRKFGLEKDNFLLFIGRLSILKGIQHLIEAFKEITKKHPNLKLAIVGTGESENYLKALAHGTKNIVFVGYINSPTVKKTLYENSVAVVAPSQYEGLPLVIIEAMACKTAVIASNVGGIPLLVKHGKNGFLIKSGDSKSIEKFCELLYEDEPLRKQMGLTGRQMAEQDFSIDKMVSQTVDVYKTLSA